MSLDSYVDLSQPSLYISVASIIFNPTFWNIAARQEYHHKTITRLFGGNSLYGCYGLAISIFLLGILRDMLFKSALQDQPTSPLLSKTYPQLATLLALALLAVGNTLVLSSMWALGITGTYLGDYFGILMPELVTGFPFNVTGSPMYWGSCLSFLGTAVWYASPAGVALTGLVWVCYKVALGFEDPFTAGIYREREEREKRAKKGAKKSR